MVSIIAIIAGAILGGVWAEGYGAASGALLGWLLVRSFQQQRQIEALQRALPVAKAAAPGLATATAPPATPAAAIEVAPGMLDEPAPMAPPAAPPAAHTQPPKPPAPPRVDVLAPIRRWLFGGNTIVKAGVGILFIGLAFLAKFASEHASLPVEFRLAAIGGVAVALLAVGWRLRQRRAGYAQVLQGGAIAVLYLTLFVSFRMYGVLAVGPVFVLMVAVAALAAALAVLQDARALAAVGALGGFAAPLLASTGSGDHVALFAYYLVLDLGIAAVAWHKTWRELNLIGFFATFIVGTAWGALAYRPENYASSQAFLIAFFLLFVAIMLMPARAGRAAEAATRGDVWITGSLLFGLPTVVFVLQYGLVRQTDYGPALSALVLAAFYVGLASWMRGRARLAATFEASLAIGTVFVTLVIPFALDARSTCGAWALEGAGLVWLGWRQARCLPRAFGYALLFLAGAAMMFGHDRHGTPEHVFNAYLFNGVLAGLASIAAAFFVHRAVASRRTPLAEAAAEPLLIGWGVLWLVAAAGFEIYRFAAWPDALAAWLASLAAIALLLTLLGDRLSWRSVTLPAIGHAPTLAFSVLVSAASLASPVQAGGWWAWPIALAVHLIVLARAAPRWPRGARVLAHTLGVLVLAGLGALQGAAITRGWGDAASAWAWLGWLVVPAVLSMALQRPGLQRQWPLRAEPPAYATHAGALLTAGLLIWTVLANVVSDGTALPLPHVPLLNPLDIGIGVALLAAWAWLRSAAGREALAAMPGAAPALVGGAGFIWLNAILIRAFHHYGGVPFRFDAWVDSLAVQTGITLLWTATALAAMWLAARRAARVPWTCGAVLLAAVVGKLLLVDLSGSGTVTRIVSFIGVGLLMLVIGYVAPWPGGKEDGHAAP